MFKFTFLIVLSEIWLVSVEMMNYSCILGINFSSSKKKGKKFLLNIVC